MKIDRTKLELLMAKACKSNADLCDAFSPSTLSRIRNNPGYDASPKTVGRLARALGVDVEDLIEEEKAG